MSDDNQEGTIISLVFIWVGFFIGIKMLGNGDWSWWWLALPFCICIVIFLIILAFAAIY